MYNIALFFSELYVPERLENDKRRITFGDKDESKRRNVFVKDLHYNSSVSLEDFKVYIEKGYWWDPWAMGKSVFKKNTGFPYQISFKKGDTIIKGIYEIMDTSQYDSITNKLLYVCIFLKEPQLKDTVKLKVVKFDKDRDSIGFIKIWD